MKYKLYFSVLIIFITFPLFTGIACNMPIIPKPVATKTEPRIPNSTQAVEELYKEIDETIEEVKANEPFQMVVTEVQLTSIINYELQSYQEYTIEDVQVHLRNGRVRITGNAEQNNFLLPVEVEVLLEANENGIPEYQIEKANVGPFQLPEFLIDQLTATIDNAFRSSILPASKEIFIEHIAIADGQLTVDGYTK